MYLVGIVLVTIFASVVYADHTEEEAKPFIDNVYKEMKKQYDVYIAATWDVVIADEAHKKQATDALKAADDKFDKYEKDSYKEIVQYKWRDFKDPNLKRLFFASNVFHDLALPPKKLQNLENVNKDVDKIRETPLVKERGKNSQKLKYGDVEGRVLNGNMDAEELKYYWKEVHDTVGRKAKGPFKKFLQEENDAAKLNGYDNFATMFKAVYEDDNFETTITNLYKEIEPLFKELHAYVRHKLWVAYGSKDDIINPKGPIPASLLGWKWGEEASPIYDKVVPYPKTPLLDITKAIQDKKMKVTDMAKTAETFYTSLGLSPLPDDFWKSILEKNPNIDCNTEIYTLANQQDQPQFRLKLCAKPTQYGHILLHQWIGYMEYSVALKDLPFIFKRPPNWGFDGAFQELMVDLSMAPNYLKSIGLLQQDFQPSNELIINTLFSKALDKLFFLPFGLAWDQWRWRVAEGKFNKDKSNCEYWDLRTNLQGVEPPVPRVDTDFDPGVQLDNISGGEPITYFMSELIKLNLLKGLCTTAGYYDPKSKPQNALVFCHIHGSKAAGDKLKKMMALGVSKPWIDSLELITGSKKLDSSAVKEYYDPLLQWLKKENDNNKVTRGWTKSEKCRKSQRFGRLRNRSQTPV